MLLEVCIQPLLRDLDPVPCVRGRMGDEIELYAVMLLAEGQQRLLVGDRNTIGYGLAGLCHQKLALLGLLECFRGDAVHLQDLFVLLLVESAVFLECRDGCNGGYDFVFRHLQPHPLGFLFHQRQADQVFYHHVSDAQLLFYFRGNGLAIDLLDGVLRLFVRP